MCCWRFSTLSGGSSWKELPHVAASSRNSSLTNTALLLVCRCAVSSRPRVLSSCSLVVSKNRTGSVLCRNRQQSHRPGGSDDSRGKPRSHTLTSISTRRRSQESMNIEGEVGPSSECCGSTGLRRSRCLRALCSLSRLHPSSSGHRRRENGEGES